MEKVIEQLKKDLLVGGFFDQNSATEVCIRKWYNPVAWFKGRIYYKAFRP